MKFILVSFETLRVDYYRLVQFRACSGFVLSKPVSPEFHVRYSFISKDYHFHGSWRDRRVFVLIFVQM